MANKWQDKDLGLMIRLLNPYSTDMKPHMGDTEAEGVATAQPAEPAEPAPEGLPPAPDLGQYHVEIDNYEGAWDFKGNTHKITRALRITYRYPVKDGHGILATEHLLIGYAGGNGG